MKDFPESLEGHRRNGRGDRDLIGRFGFVEKRAISNTLSNSALPSPIGAAVGQDADLVIFTRPNTPVTKISFSFRGMNTPPSVLKIGLVPSFGDRALVIA
jgi:hypothetical protein